MAQISIKDIQQDDHDWIKVLLIKEWSSVKVVTQGRVYYADNLPGFIAIYQNQKVGLLTYNLHKDILEIVTLNSIINNIGIGTKLLKHIINFAKSKKIKSIEVTTTNDNINALCFYQIRGFWIKKVNVNVIKEYKKLKPEIPLKGYKDIPLRDEIVLEKLIF
ncbi:MAG: GNAT family N-acetyltransferase [Candidatus Lokiarchaeota archaeon]